MSVKDSHRDAVFRDVVTSDSYHGNTSERWSPEVGEGEEGEYGGGGDGGKAAWRQLPKVYLKLSKSRLTGEFVCIGCVYYSKLHPLTPPTPSPGGSDSCWWVCHGPRADGPGGAALHHIRNGSLLSIS